MNSDPISILVVDDHAVVRQGVISFLSTQPDFIIVGEASSGEEAVKACIEHAPDVALLDLLMNGAAASKRPGKSDRSALALRSLF